MWFLCQEPCNTLDQARKRAMEIGRENFDSIHKERYGLFLKKTVYVVLWWKWINKGCDEKIVDRNFFDNKMQRVLWLWNK